MDFADHNNYDGLQRGKVRTRLEETPSNAKQKLFKIRFKIVET